MILKDFVNFSPSISIIVFSFIITFILTWTYKKFSNQEELKNSKEKTKELQGRIKNEKDQAKIMEMQKEMLQISMDQMRHSMKPMLITFLPLIGVFALLRYLYTGVGNIVSWKFSIPVFCKILPGLCDGAGWFLSYVVLSMAFNIILRKILKVH